VIAAVVGEFRGLVGVVGDGAAVVGCNALGRAAQVVLEGLALDAARVRAGIDPTAGQRVADNA
jgi:hypothetical protein